MFGFVRRNGFGIAFFVLFAAALVALIVEGASATGIPAADYARTSEFVEEVMVNWQAAILQLLVLTLGGSLLFQRGASHSRDPQHHPMGRQSRKSWVYRHSLSLALSALFALAFAGHVSAWARLHGTPARVIALMPGFWKDTFATLQAEFFAMGAFLVLTIFLRQQHSPESKPVDAPNSETGTHEK